MSEKGTNKGQFSKAIWIIASAAVAYGLYEGRKLLRFANDFQMHITKFGIPSINQGRLYFPITVEIDNPTPSTLTIDSIFVTISRFENNEWIVIGNSQPDLLDIAINPLKTTSIHPEISVPFTNVGSTIWKFFQNANERMFKLDVKIDIGGNTLTTTEIKQL